MPRVKRLVETERGDMNRSHCYFLLPLLFVFLGLAYFSYYCSCAFWLFDTQCKSLAELLTSNPFFSEYELKRAPIPPWAKDYFKVKEGYPRLLQKWSEEMESFSRAPSKDRESSEDLLEFSRLLCRSFRIDVKDLDEKLDATAHPLAKFSGLKRKLEKTCNLAESALFQSLSSSEPGQASEAPSALELLTAIEHLYTSLMGGFAKRDSLCSAYLAMKLLEKRNSAIERAIVSAKVDRHTIEELRRGLQRLSRSRRDPLPYLVEKEEARFAKLTSAAFDNNLIGSFILHRLITPPLEDLEDYTRALSEAVTLDPQARPKRLKTLIESRYMEKNELFILWDALRVDWAELASRWNEVLAREDEIQRKLRDSRRRGAR